jgi:membrane associated rhomboid family serine protease
VVIPIHDDNPTRRTAIVTYVLIALNFVVFFTEPVVSQFGVGTQTVVQACDQQRYFDHNAAIPYELTHNKPLPPHVYRIDSTAGEFDCTVTETGKKPYLSVLFSMFLHGGWLHILGNMLFLWIFGNNVEDQLGPVGFLTLYLVGGIVASLVHVLGNLDSTSPFLGASGAIAVVMGAYIVWFPRARVLTVIPPFFFLPFRLPAVVVLGLWFVLQLFTQSSAGVATLAHIGGFVFGVLVAFLLARTAGFPRPAPTARLGH